MSRRILSVATLAALAMGGLSTDAINRVHEGARRRDPEPEPSPTPTTDGPVEYPYYNAAAPLDNRLAVLRRERLAAEGKRQGDRIAAKRSKFDFSASERCIERIKARLADSSPAIGDGKP